MATTADGLPPGWFRRAERPTLTTSPEPSRQIVHASTLHAGQLVWWGQVGVGLDGLPYDTRGWWAVERIEPPRPGRLGITHLYDEREAETDEVVWSVDCPTDLVVTDPNT